MNEIRYTKLQEFVNAGYKLSLKISPLRDKVNVVVTNPTNCELHKYDHKGHVRRIVFYEAETQKSWDYSIYELMAHILGLEHSLKWTKSNVQNILKPALRKAMKG